MDEAPPSRADPSASEEAPHVPPPEEKLTELLGELVETVSKVQETWEEIRTGSNDHTDNNHEQIPDATSH